MPGAAGHVRFRQDRTVMYCDSAYFYSSQNSFDAFGHVRVVQDSTELTANKMFYDGNLKLMRVRENITMRSGHFVLTTQKLDYYRQRVLPITMKVPKSLTLSSILLRESVIIIPRRVKPFQARC